MRNSSFLSYSLRVVDVFEPVKTDRAGGITLTRYRRTNINVNLIAYFTKHTKRTCIREQSWAEGDVDSGMGMVFAPY